MKPPAERAPRLLGDRAQDAPLERHVVKRRPGRREAVFVGTTRLVDGRREVARGWIVKTVRPERVAHLLEQQAALSAALPDAGADALGLPRVPALVEHHAKEGRVVFHAFPGASLAALPDGPRRSRTLAASAAALGRLERTEHARALWPRRSWSVAHEFAVLDGLAVKLGRELPSFGPVLRARLASSADALGPVPAHRDLNEEQIVAPPGEGASTDGRVGWIDWDEAALAPAGLDLGNLLAHERLRGLRERRPADGFDGAPLVEIYRAAGGRAGPRDVAAWEAAACLRLAFLARRAARAKEGERNPEWVPLPPHDPAEAAWRASALEELARALLDG